MIVVSLMTNEVSMNRTFAIIDLANLYSRAKYVTKGDIMERMGMAIHITISSMKKSWNEFNADHFVICLEGRSWRKDVYKPYKLNRQDKYTQMSSEEIDDEKKFWESLSEFQKFLDEKTNCTVLQHPNLEADDLVAGWIQVHPNDNHIILSSDSDFEQLVSDNVRQYNGISEVLTTIDGYFINGKPVYDKKTGLKKEPPNPSWSLFEKCIRGDRSDNIFSAYPGVRKKGTKNKVGLLEAFEDKQEKGFNWNNLMLQRWSDHNGIEHRVIDDYQRNVELIDLTAQPQHVKSMIDETINAVKPKHVQQVGIHLMRFCSKWELETISDQVEQFAQMFSAKYTGEIVYAGKSMVPWLSEIFKQFLDQDNTDSWIGYLNSRLDEYGAELINDGNDFRFKTPKQKTMFLMKYAHIIGVLG